jgi:hypothetical protein
MKNSVRPEGYTFQEDEVREWSSSGNCHGQASGLDSTMRASD